ncbi:MAG TPA: urea ABC transporter permease subunit UrtB [Steroidobacteraceae bacterium]|jgi:urea transport system permease protein|nr:urea ABC transporter permease subunit UrtB [Steroidobacteraceae bacterium]
MGKTVDARLVAQLLAQQLLQWPVQPAVGSVRQLGKWLRICLLIMGLMSVPILGFSQSPQTQDLAQVLQQLPAAGFTDKQTLVDQLSQMHDPQVRAILTALLEGNLYSRGSDGRVFITAVDGEQLKLTDPVSGGPAGAASPDDLSKITVNNSLRKALKVALAQFDLVSPSAQVRLGAVHEMLRGVDDQVIAALRAHLPAESDKSVRRAILDALALADLDSSEAPVRLAAVKDLAGSLNGDVYNRLTAIATPDSDGHFSESDAGVRKAAQTSLKSIDHWRSFYAGIQVLMFGLSQGSVLVLAAIGLAITFGVMGVINMAHGELMMLGAYTTYVVQLLMPQHIGLSIAVAIPAAFLVSGLAGVAIERGIVRFLYGRPLETLLATFGLSLILQQVVRDLFTANNRPVQTPDWLAGELQINDALSITYNRLYIILFTFVMFLGLLAILKRTRLGLEVRAVSQNRPMAKAMGIRTEWVDAMTFGLGSGIAGIAGVALSQLTNVGPNLGQSYIVDCFMVVVFGGVGNLWGTELGGNTLGVVNKLLEPYSGAVLAKIFVLVALILFIQRRPRGLFPQKGRAAEV